MSPSGVSKAAKAKQAGTRSLRGNVLAPERPVCTVDPGDCREHPTYRRAGVEWPTRCSVHKEVGMVLVDSAKGAKAAAGKKKETSSFVGLSSVASSDNEGSTKEKRCTVRNCKLVATWTLFSNMQQTPMYREMHGKKHGDAAHVCPDLHEEGDCRHIVL